MAANRDLRLQLDERLQGALRGLLAQYGLAAVQVDTLVLRHDKYDANREKVGSLWLAADERHVELEHSRHLDELYDAAEWQKIRRGELESRARHRRAELALEDAEQAHALRSREIELYSRVVDSDSRKQAIERGAGDVLAELEHDLARKGVQRADEVAQWAHLRELARIRMRTELEVAQQDAQQARQLAQQRFSHQLLQQQIRNKVEQALAIEDASRQRAELARLRGAQDLAERRARELDEEEHLARRQALELANAARRREAERVLEWEEETARQKLEEMRRGGAQADAIAQHEKLLRTIEAEALHSRATQQVELDGEERRHALRRQEQEAQWQQELRRLAHASSERAAQHAQAIELARIEIARAESLGAMGDMAKLALAPAANATALADYMKTQVHATMRADQLAALSGVVSSAHGVAPLEAAGMARELLREERALRDAQADTERRHQLDLLAAGRGLPGRRCNQGHAARDGDVFCAACGAALGA
jgi:hypothetical protein